MRHDAGGVGVVAASVVPPGTAASADPLNPSESAFEAAFEAGFDRLPLVAILRGAGPAEAAAAGAALWCAGFSLVEVTLNSPQPLQSIGRLHAELPAGCLVGAGTVLSPEDVARAVEAGARFIVMPHGDPRTIRAARDAGVACLPGVATPTEAFAALDAGATALKLFPADMIGPRGLVAWRSVLPAWCRVLPVGGVTPESVAAWRAAGAAGFGLGSALFRAGQTPEHTAQRAASFVGAWRAARAG